MHRLWPRLARRPAQPASQLCLPSSRIPACAGVPGVKPVTIELTDFKTKEVVDELEVDACLVATGRAPYTNGLSLQSINVQTDRRGFVPVNDKMQASAGKGGRGLGGGWQGEAGGGVRRVAGWDGGLLSCCLEPLASLP